MVVLTAFGLCVGFRKHRWSANCFFWIMKSYQHGTRIGGERDLRPKHITAWTKNAAENFAYVCARLHACICVYVRLCASVCMRLRPEN